MKELEVIWRFAATGDWTGERSVNQILKEHLRAGAASLLVCVKGRRKPHAAETGGLILEKNVIRIPLFLIARQKRRFATRPVNGPERSVLHLRADKDVAMGA